MTSVRTAAPWGRARRLLQAQLPLPITHVVHLEHLETPAVVRRRRRVVARVSVPGTGLLGLSLSTKPGSRAFYTLTTAFTRNPAPMLAAGVMGALFGCSAARPAGWGPRC
jgi:hypothetical protein